MSKNITYFENEFKDQKNILLEKINENKKKKEVVDRMNMKIEISLLKGKDELYKVLLLL